MSRKPCGSGCVHMRAHHWPGCHLKGFYVAVCGHRYSLRPPPLGLCLSTHKNTKSFQHRALTSTLLSAINVTWTKRHTTPRDRTHQIVCVCVWLWRAQGRKWAHINATLFERRSRALLYKQIGMTRARTPPMTLKTIMKFLFGIPRISLRGTHSHNRPTSNGY